MANKLSQTYIEATRFALQGMAYSATRVACEVEAKAKRDVRFSNSLHS